MQFGRYIYCILKDCNSIIIINIIIAIFSMFSFEDEEDVDAELLDISLKAEIFNENKCFRCCFVKYT